MSEEMPKRETIFQRTTDNLHSTSNLLKVTARTWSRYGAAHEERKSGEVEGGHRASFPLRESEKFSGRSDVVCDTGKAEAAVAAAKDKAAAVKIGLIIARVPLFRRHRSLEFSGACPQDKLHLPIRFNLKIREGFAFRQT
jgi:hypothetical protein